MEQPLGIFLEEQFGEFFAVGLGDDPVRFRHDELIEPTRWHADLVLNGTFLNGVGADVVTSYVAEKLR